MTVFLAVAASALFLVTGLVIDGGAQLRAAQHAQATAEEAARAAAQALDTTQVMQGGEVEADPQAAVQAATDYLRAVDASGTAYPETATTLTVHVTETRPTTLLPLLGVTELTAHGHASARIASAP